MLSKRRAGVRLRFIQQQLRAGVNYRFGADATPASSSLMATPTGSDNINFHGQTTFVWQGYPSIRSPYTGLNSLPGSG